MNQEIYDVIVVGAGPVGLYTGYYCGLRKLKTLICDSLAYPGGQLYNLYPEKKIYDLPGFVSITAKQFVFNLLDQVELVKDHVDFKLNTTVTNFTLNNNNLYQVETNQTSFLTKSIILASGNGSFQPRKLGIENENNMKNIYYYINDVNTFKDKNVTIFGGGDSAVDWALTLNRIAKTVTIVHRREEFRAKQAIVDSLVKSNINIITSSTVQSVKDNDNYIIEVTLKNNKNDELNTIDTDAVIVNYGVIIANGFLSNSKIAQQAGKVIINQQLETNLPGIFACGDVCFYHGREVQITTGLGEGLIASASAFHYIYPEEKMVAIR